MAIGGDGVGETALVLERVAQIEVGRGGARLEVDGRTAGGDRFVKPSKPPENFAEIGMTGRILRPKRGGLSEELGRRLVVAGLMGQHSEHLERVGVARLNREHLPIKGFRFRQTIGPVVEERILKRLLDRHDLNPPLTGFPLFRTCENLQLLAHPL